MAAPEEFHEGQLEPGSPWFLFNTWLANLHHLLGFHNIIVQVSGIDNQVL